MFRSSQSAPGAKKAGSHARSRGRMNEHSKIVGYLTLAILLIVFVAWAKYAAVSDAVFWTILIATCVFFVGWRAVMGTWPGNDASR